MTYNVMHTMQVSSVRTPHPGEVLRREFLDAYGLSANRLALELRVPATRIGDILNGRRSITADTALRLARYFGTSAEYWMQLQSDYDLATAAQKLKDAIEREVIPHPEREAGAIVSRETPVIARAAGKGASQNVSRETLLTEPQPPAHDFAPTSDIGMTSQPGLDPIDQLLAAALPEGSLYAVGGRVRDEVRASIEGSEPATKDLDYVVTGVPLEELRHRLEAIGRVDAVGAAFAILKLTAGGRTVDIALPRRERSTGHGHREFSVQSGPEIPLDEDLARRDFRMNMMARAIPSGRLVDPFGGEADIRARRIDILTSKTFEEDPLRMLRAAQFAARLEYAVTPATRAAMTDAAALVQTVSAERVSDELTKLLVKARRPSVGLELLRETGVLAYLWPELVEGFGVEQNEWHAYDVWNHSLATLDATPPGDLVLRLSALLHDVAKPRTKDGPHFYGHEIVGAGMAGEMLGRFRFSNDVVERTSHLVRQHMFAADPAMKDATVRRFIRRIGASNIEHLFALRAADVAGSGLPKRGEHNERFLERVRAELARKPPFAVADLAIGGDAVIAALIARGDAAPGFRGDARVGEALRWLFEQVTDAPERNEPISLQRLLERYLDVRARDASA